MMISSSKTLTNPIKLLKNPSLASLGPVFLLHMKLPHTQWFKKCGIESDLFFNNSRPVSLGVFFLYIRNYPSTMVRNMLDEF